MTAYRFLPWTRQGLAARLETPDPLDDTLASQPQLPVRVRVNNGTPVGVDVTLHGPGDIIGVDGRGIVRVEPAPSSTGVEPNYLASVEFDRPDFPWMFTPAAAGDRRRLRPWLVLAVVEHTADSRITPHRNRPLPTVTVDAGELPPLDDSWAWAHTQVITEVDTTAAILEAIRSQPDLTVARLLCPRRLAPDTEYLACLVPAFAAGVAAGLGAPVDPADTLAPAWTDGVGRVQLPVYHHWEFATGPAGDFESLARRLAPPDRPLAVGTVPVYVGRADPGLPDLTGPAAVVTAEGALVGPFHDTSAPPPDLGIGWLGALRAILDAGADDLDDPSDRPPISPPLYGAWAAGVHRTPTDEPAWVRDVNVDPRRRIVAGVGTEVVRAEQEAFVHDAWEQVGELATANALVDRGRLSREIAALLHRRLFGNSDGERTFRLATPAHRRVLVEGATVAARLHESAVPDAVASPAFRRMTARGGAVRRRARKHAPAASTAAVSPTAAASSMVTRLDAGALATEPAEIVPDALTESRALGALGPIGGGQVDLSPIGGKRTINAKVLKSVQTAATKVGQPPLPGQISVRPDLSTKGVIVERRPVLTPGGAVIVRDRSLPVDPRAVDPGGIRSRLASTRLPGVRPPLAPPLPPIRRPPTDRPPTDRPPIDRPPIDRPPIDRPPTDRPPIDPLPPRVVVSRFTDALAAHVATLIEPEPKPAHPVLGLEQVRVGLIAGIDPGRVVPSRVASMIEVPAQPDPGEREPVIAFEPDMRGLIGSPQLDRPIYELVAAHAPEWLLPGIGDIPSDTVALLATNPQVVESMLIAANAELLAELVWREYPTRRNETPLRRFWARVDGRPDLPALDAVDPAARLGQLGGGDGTGDAVLVVRGELLRRYPNTIVSLVKATATGDVSESPADQHEPTLRGRIDPDVTFVGFDVTIDEMTGEPGFFIVLQQQPTEPRFGFDVPDGEGNQPATWRDATWAHVGVEPGGHIRSDPDRIVNPNDTGGATWLTNSAHLASIAMQQPVRVAIHANELLRSQVTR